MLASGAKNEETRLWQSSTLNASKFDNMERNLLLDYKGLFSLSKKDCRIRKHFN